MLSSVFSFLIAICQFLEWLYALPVAMPLLRPLEPPDSHFLNAAEGWLELGCPSDADQELDKIDLSLHSHPDVLKLRCEVCCRSKQWDKMIEIAKQMIQLFPERPEGWINRSNALHFLQNYQEAYDTLRPALERFPESPHLRYNLACFCCRMNRLEEAQNWLKQAFSIKGGSALRPLALADPDLAPLRHRIKRGGDEAS